MGGFTAEIGTVYHSLFDSALTAFAIETQSPVQLACYGDPAGMDVRCESKISDFSILIETPQSYGERDQYGGRTAGVLRVSRVVEARAPDLAWINPERIAAAFSVQPVLDIFAKQQMIESMSKRVERAKQRINRCISNDWLSDSGKMPEGWVDNRAVVLFSNRDQRMFACQIRGPSDGSMIACPRGFPCRIILTDIQRWEFFLYEFQLSGTNSWDFQLLDSVSGVAES